jgi:hypothetical protein
MAEPADPDTRPAFYAARQGRWRDWWTILHPPYTAWHLSYVVLGAALAPVVDGVRLLATLLAFFLAVGIGAHALDELHGHPLRTAVSDGVLWAVSVASLAGAVALGLAGVARVGPGLLVFIALGPLLVLAYNLEPFGGRLHSDVTFAAAWGSFPVVTAFYAQAETLLRLEVVAGAAAAFAISYAQRALSTPARALRRRVDEVEGTVRFRDGTETALDRTALLRPLERALHAMSWGMVALAVALALARLT